MGDEVTVRLMEMLLRWIDYSEGIALAMFGQITVMANIAQSARYITIRRATLGVMAAGGCGLLIYLLFGDGFPARGGIAFGAGMLAAPMIDKMSRNGPAWMVRLFKGPGSPLDDDNEK